jgi:hypothetical protein
MILNTTPIADIFAFRRALAEFVAAALPNQDAHKKDMTFALGNALVGFHLYVDSQGWTSALDRKVIGGFSHIASPLANLQAAALFISHS